MTLLQTANIDMEISRLKKELDKSGLRRELKLKAIPKKSERLREKIRFAKIRWRKRERMPEGRDSRNEKQPWWEFVYRDGEYHKKMIPRKG